MEVSDAGLMEIAAHEGIVPYPYRDSVGVWTFGIGHTAAAGAPDPSRMERGKEQPLSFVMKLFRDDIARFAQDVRQAVKVDLHQHEFDALVSFHFNTGAIRRASITRLLNAGDRAGAAEAFDSWHKPPEVIGRRDKEKLLFRAGRYSNQGMANAYPADAKGRVQWKKGRRVDLTKALAAPKPVPVEAVGDPIVIAPAPPVEPIHDGLGAETLGQPEKPAGGLPWAAIGVVALVAIGIALAATFL